MNTLNLDGMSRDELAYALSKHIPAMPRGFSIVTNYGEIEIDANEAAPFVAALQRKLERRLRREQKRAGA